MWHMDRIYVFPSILLIVAGLLRHTRGKIGKTLIYIPIWCGVSSWVTVWNIMNRTSLTVMLTSSEIWWWMSICAISDIKVWDYGFPPLRRYSDVLKEPTPSIRRCITGLQREDKSYSSFPYMFKCVEKSNQYWWVYSTRDVMVLKAHK